MSSSATDPGGRSPADIEDDVERTRADVSGTLDELRERLAPGQIVDEVIDRISDYARGSGGAAFARNLGCAVRDNPLPLLLIGAGVGWLMLSGGGSSAAPERYRPRLPPPREKLSEGDGLSAGVSGAVERAGAAASAVGDAAARAGSSISTAASSVMDAGSDFAGSAAEAGAAVSRKAASFRETAGAATERASSALRAGWSSGAGIMEAQPLLVGLLGLVAGATLGAALPRSEIEDEMLGPTADAATERVSRLAREATEEVRNVAGEHLQGTTDTMAEGYAKVKEQLSEGSLSGAGEALGEALGATARATGEAAGGIAGEVKGRLEKDRPEDRERGTSG